MKAILMSIRPKWIEKIASGEKTVEVRKTVPKCGAPFKVYIYETKAQYVSYQKGALTKYGYGKGKVIGEFVCDNIRPFEVQSPAYWYMMNKAILEQACLTKEELHDYIGAGNLAYGLHISDLKIYDKPKELGEFRKPCDKSNEKCITCKRFMGAAGLPFCDDLLTRPPQSWQFVEEI